MPTDANGVYTLPPGYLATAGTIIQPAQHNPPLEDIAAAITGRLMASGANAMTGQFKAIDGSASAPGITFGLALNTGLYRTSGGNVGISVGGSEVLEVGPLGVVKGGRFLGEIFDHTGSAPPPLCVFVVGQTLSRAAYPDLWAFAQSEIALGNLFFNNGNGTTTFGIGDARGRVRAGVDGAIGRLTATTITPGAGVIGAAGGTETYALSLAQAPTGITSSGSVSGTAALGGSYVITQGVGAALVNVAGGGVGTAPQIGTAAQTPSLTVAGTAAVTSTNTGGAAHPNVQPTLITNTCLFAGA